MRDDFVTEDREVPGLTIFDWSPMGFHRRQIDGHKRALLVGRNNASIQLLAAAADRAATAMEAFGDTLRGWHEQQSQG